jgi:hypothetical protein
MRNLQARNRLTLHQAAEAAAAALAMEASALPTALEEALVLIAEAALVGLQLSHTVYMR